MKKHGLVYAKPSLIVEPLVAEWYAYVQLISPLTFAMTLANRYLPILDSFLLYPKAHAKALRNPKMLGGPFLDFDPERAPEIDALRGTYHRDFATQFELAHAAKTLHSLLRERAKGGSLADLYPLAPDSLRGLVELVYAMDHHPSFRIKEALMYRTSHYREDAQGVLLHLSDGDNRPFVFGTPRLASAEQLKLAIPLRSPALDTLSISRSSPIQLERLMDELGVRADQADAFAGFFDAAAPEKGIPNRIPPSSICYMGHACLAFRSREACFLFDPLISPSTSAGDGRLTYDDLPGHLDCIFITHAHLDHCLLETLLRIRHKTGMVVVPRNNPGSLQDPSLALAIKAVGFRNVVELGDLESVVLPGAKITAIPFLGEHCDLDIASKTAYLVEMDSRKTLLLSDSNNLEPRLYERLHDHIGDVDTIFIGMECVGAPLDWIYGQYQLEPLEGGKARERRLDGSDKARALSIMGCFRPRNVYVYAMGQEPWMKHINAVDYSSDPSALLESDSFIAACRSGGIAAERLLISRILAPDGSPVPVREPDGRLKPELINV